MKNCSWVLVVLTLLLTTYQFNAQSIEFEVATIKPYRNAGTMGDVFTGGGCHGIDSHYPANTSFIPPLGRCVFQMMTLKRLLRDAYSVTISGGPAWVSTDNFNIESKVDDPSAVTEARLRVMLQNLLKERFKVEFHRERREVQGFALLVSKEGLKLKPSSGGKPSTLFFSQNTFTAVSASMSQVAVQLGAQLGGIVRDETGLLETYDFSLPVNLESGETTESLFTALQKVGLRIETRSKIPIETIIIDHAEKPILN